MHNFSPIPFVLVFGIVCQVIHAETFDPENGYVGIAVSAGKNSDYPAVTYVASSGPASLAGLKAGDGILAVDGASIHGLSGTEIMPRIDGKAGTAVVITLRREGVPDAQITLMRQSLLDTYLPAAAGGDPKAQSRIGYFYEFGPAQTRDLSKALEWYRKSADQGYAIAQTDLGYIYGHGLGVPEDQKAAAAWYLKAARRGDAVAERNLALGYLKGKGVQQSDQDAFNWFYSAAQQDDPTAEQYLGFLYWKGRGVARNDQAAFAWYYRSAQRNEPYGQESLAFMYVHGLGVAHDNAEALKWYLKAQTGLPKSKSLKKAIALATLGTFLENRSSVSTLDLSLLENAFQQEIWHLFIGLTVVYLAGGLTLLYFTFHATSAAPRLSVALGWIAFYLESQGMAFLVLCIFETKIGADTFIGITSLLCALPVIISSCGTARTRIWKSSPVSWNGLLFYGAASLIAMTVIGLGYERIYWWIAHSTLPAQPTLALIGKSKDTSPLVAFLTIALLLPVTEEILFRGFLFEGLRRFFSGEITVTISALAFAAIHFQLLYFVPLFGFGLICGWARLKTDSIRLPIFLHIINNGLMLALVV